MALRRPRSRATLVVAAAVVVVVAAGGLAFRAYQGSLPDVVSPGPADARLVPAAAAETPYVVDGFGVCLSREGSVRVVDVAFVTNQGGARVVEWGVRPQLAAQGGRPSVPRTLAEVGGFERRTVTRPCTTPRETSELGLEVRKSTDQIGVGMDLRITYETGPFTREVEVETDVVLCGPSDRSPGLARACASVVEQDPTVTATPTPRPTPSAPPVTTP